MTETECRERVRRAAGRAGLETYFLLPGQIAGTAAVGAVFTVGDFDSDLAEFDPATADEAAIGAVIEQARRTLAGRCGCEIVHAGRGLFRCLRHAVDCATGEEQDPVIRQTLRWTATCPEGEVTQSFYLSAR